jgi:predicted dinucleotide-binding enzyme
MAEHLTIAVLGAGSIGGTLGRAWASASHTVIFGVRDPQSQKNQAAFKNAGGNVRLGSIADALSSNPEVVVMAIPGTAMDATIAAYAASLDGRIIIDTANRLDGGPANSFATFQKQTPHAQVYRAFNSLGWENFANPLFDGVHADLFYCGPDGTSRQLVEQLIGDVGLRPIYVGGSERVGVVDSVASLWFALALGQHRGRHLAFKMLSDQSE